MRWIVALAAAGAAAISAAQGYNASVRFDPDQAFTSPRMKEIGVEQRLGQPVLGVAEFRDQNGQPVRFDRLLGKRPVILLPIFYRCTGVCDLELKGIVSALNELPEWRIGRDVQIVALGLNPKETPELARNRLALLKPAYEFGAAEGWTFLTGDLANTKAVTDSLGFKFAYDAAKDEVSHPSGIMILTPKGTISSYILGANYEPAKLDGLLKTARNEEVGQRVKEIFFGCIHIDPVTGKRSIMIQNVLKVLGVVTLVAMALAFAALTGRLRRPSAGAAE
jgi:protein SCO1/2